MQIGRLIDQEGERRLTVATHTGQGRRGAARTGWLGLFPSQPGEAEIQDFHAAGSRDHQVLRFDIAVHHPLFIGVLEPERHLANEPAGELQRQRSPHFDLSSEAEPIDIFHHQEVQVARLLGVESRHDVWVRQLRRRLHFHPETLDRLGVVHQHLADDLERHRPLHQAVLGLVHHPHAADAQLPDDSVAGMVRQVGGQRRRISPRISERGPQRLGIACDRGKLLGGRARRRPTEIDVGHRFRGDRRRDE